jgi:hypothetical protein
MTIRRKVIPLQRQDPAAGLRPRRFFDPCFGACFGRADARRRRPGRPDTPSRMSTPPRAPGDPARHIDRRIQPSSCAARPRRNRGCGNRQIPSSPVQAQVISESRMQPGPKLTGSDPAGSARSAGRARSAGIARLRSPPKCRYILPALTMVYTSRVSIIPIYSKSQIQAWAGRIRQ